MVSYKKKKKSNPLYNPYNAPFFHNWETEMTIRLYDYLECNDSECCLVHTVMPVE